MGNDGGSSNKNFKKAIDTSSSGNLAYGSGGHTKHPSSTKMSNQSINKFTKLNRNMAPTSYT